MCPVSLAMHINPSTRATIIIFRLFLSVTTQVFVALCCTGVSSKEEKPNAKEKQGTENKQMFVGAAIVSQEEALTGQKVCCESGSYVLVSSSTADTETPAKS